MPNLCWEAICFRECISLGKSLEKEWLKAKGITIIIKCLLIINYVPSNSKNLMYIK